MQLPLYHVDAFTDTIFAGNPAAVCLLPHWFADDTLHAISKENNLPATAFLVREGNDFATRWITPEYELELCGHGTLASAFVIFNFVEIHREKIVIRSAREALEIYRNHDVITLNFPSKPAEILSTDNHLEKGLGLSPQAVFHYKNERLLAIFNDEDEIKKLQPDMKILKQIDHRGIIVTAPGKTVDYVSRTFYPQKTISEDAATGSSHCLLVPYWKDRLKKNEFRALQLSKRGGAMFCKYENDRVLVSGKAVLYMQGNIFLKN